MYEYYIGELLITRGYPIISEGDVLSMFRVKAMIGGGVLMLHCTRPPINTTQVLVEKFANSSRHRLSYRIRHDDILPDVPFPKNNEVCETYKRDWRRTWPVVRNIFDAYISDHQGITLVTQFSFDRIAAFRQTLKHWKGMRKCFVLQRSIPIFKYSKAIAWCAMDIALGNGMLCTGVSCSDGGLWSDMLYSDGGLSSSGVPRYGIYKLFYAGAVSVAVYFKESRTMEFLKTMAEIVGTRCNVYVHAVIQGEVRDTNTSHLQQNRIMPVFG